jgi:D-3-phosphoglycerate dehydrogenase
LKTADLVDALEQGKVLGAALDVMEFETLSFEQLDEIPAPLKALIASDKTILSPHIAGWTHESNLKMAQILLVLFFATNHHEICRLLMRRHWSRIFHKI